MFGLIRQFGSVGSGHAYYGDIMYYDDDTVGDTMTTRPSGLP